jgi:hypothetical protein
MRFGCDSSTAAQDSTEPERVLSLSAEDSGVFKFCERMRRSDRGIHFLRWSLQLAGTGWLILQGCALSLAQTGIWIDVPPVSAGNPFCAHGCASMIVRYWSQKGHPAGTAELPQIKGELPFDPRQGASAQSLISFFQARGCQAFAFQGTREDLWAHLEKGRPLIVGLEKKKGVRHFVVVAGFDQNGSSVRVADPAEGRPIKSAWETFKREWSRTGYWTLLVLPPSPPPLAGEPSSP